MITIEEIRERRAKRIVFWSLVLSMAWPIALILVWTAPFELSFYGGPLAILGWVLSGLVGLVLAGIAFSQKAHGRMLAILVLPATALLAAINVNLVWDTSMRWGYLIHAGVMKPFYLRDIDKLPAEQPKLAAFSWGSFVDVSLGVVYDESDEIAKPPEARPPAWNQRATGTLAACEVLETLPAGDHFYVVRVAC